MLLSRRVFTRRAPLRAPCRRPASTSTSARALRRHSLEAGAGLLVTGTLSLGLIFSFFYTAASDTSITDTLLTRGVCVAALLGGGGTGLHAPPRRVRGEKAAPPTLAPPSTPPPASASALVLLSAPFVVLDVGGTVASVLLLLVGGAAAATSPTLRLRAPAILSVFLVGSWAGYAPTVARDGVAAVRVAAELQKAGGEKGARFDTRLASLAGWDWTRDPAGWASTAGALAVDVASYYRADVTRRIPVLVDAGGAHVASGPGEGARAVAAYAAFSWASAGFWPALLIPAALAYDVGGLSRVVDTVPKHMRGGGGGRRGGATPAPPPEPGVAVVGLAARGAMR